MSTSQDARDRLRSVSARAFMDEKEAVDALLPDARRFEGKTLSIYARAERYVSALRAQGKRSGIEEFQHEYGLSSREGIMIMCLAEALLRIPDAATADALIHDKLTGGQWDKHTGFGRPWLTRAGALGLEIADAISDPQMLKSSAGQFIGGLVHRLGEPIVRSALKAAMKTMGSAFVIGSTLDSAKHHAKEQRKAGILFSFDMLGEGARTAAQAQTYFERYMAAIEAADGGDSISIKLSALHPRLELRHLETLECELLPVLRKLVTAAARKNVPLTVDAEEATRLDVTLLLFAELLKSPECDGYSGLGLAIQAYQKRTPYVIGWLASLARETGKRIPVRLVKGAYWDGEIKRAQEAGLEGYPVFTRKAHTDISYLACAVKLLDAPECFYPQFATHNARTIASIIEIAGDTEYEFQRLWGMGEGLYQEVLKDSPRPCRIYAPVGEPEHLLSYLIRRILENGANSSFVRGLFDAPLETLLADPIILSGGSAIALPMDVTASRRNSRGYDLGNLVRLELLSSIIISTTEIPKDASVLDCTAAYVKAQAISLSWRDEKKRPELLEQVAEMFEAHEHELLSLLISEGIKTIADSIAEIREAVDYCRYYAAESRALTLRVLPSVSGERNTLELEPRGVFLAISPWNFPLAIFTGQIAAALVTGNCVIAKPAEQTPRIAAFAVECMHKAGIPRDVLQLICGSGETVAQTLVSAPACAGVAFTGSTETAWAINRTLAARNAPIATLIAETGGQNCMIVDSSALIEQAVDDIVTSAFGSAGQRCSALRVLFVQEDIADTLLDVLSGAMMQLRVGPANDFSTDIPPVIDQASYDALSRHIARMKKEARLIGTAPLPQNAEIQLLVAPHAFEISSVKMLTKEVFGPILHVVRWKEGMLDNVIAQINSTGYGLTFGIHSRIDERVRYACEHVQAGNIYVNRSMIGASVGMQPFGGHGLSGTGPKAGGPHYLARFCRERVICVNTAAVGGNVELLA